MRLRHTKQAAPSILQPLKKARYSWRRAAFARHADMSQQALLPAGTPTPFAEAHEPPWRHYVGLKKTLFGRASWPLELIEYQFPTIPAPPATQRYMGQQKCMMSLAVSCDIAIKKLGSNAAFCCHDATSPKSRTPIFRQGAVIAIEHFTATMRLQRRQASRPFLSFSAPAQI